MAATTKLPMSPQGEPESDKAAAAGAVAGRKREEAIRVGVLAALGRPSRLFRVAVTPLWDNHYRVNVVTGEDATAVTIPNSYFVTADDLGKITGSAPPILKQY